MPNPLKVLLLVACFAVIPSLPAWAGGVPSSPPGLAMDPEFQEKGKRLFLDYCAHCHGNHGDGDGFNAEFLDKDPAELSSPEFLAKRTNDQLFRVISEGGAKVKKSHLMPVFGHTLSEEEIWSLIAFIRQLGQGGSAVTAPEGVNTERPLGSVLSRSAMDSFLKWFAEEGQKKEQTKSGELLIMNKKSCLGCHQLNEEGGRIGPNLDRSSFNYRPEWIYAWVSNPQAFHPDTKMPNLGLEPKEARAITAFLVSFQPEEDDEEEKSEAGIPDDWQQYLSTVGDAVRGEKIFNDAEGTANCAKCHLVKGKGGTVGPELSIVGTSRTREFLLESVLDPNVVITAGYKTIMILTKDRKFITGIKVNEDESGFDIVDKEGKDRHIPRDKVKKFKTQKISTMPGNFKDLLEVQEVADLLAYLGTLTLPAITSAQ